MAKQSNTIMEMIEDLSYEENNDDEHETTEILTFPGIDSNALHKVFEWCENRILALSLCHGYNLMARNEEIEMKEHLCAWAEEFIDDIFSQNNVTSSVFDIVNAAHYLQVMDLYDVLIDESINLI